MMEVREFAKSQRRMCRTYPSCEGCPLKDMLCCQIGDENGETNDEIIISIVEEWVGKHPVKTRQSEFLKLHPHTTLDTDGIIRACVSDMECDFICMGNCVKCRKDYWLEEIE